MPGLPKPNRSSTVDKGKKGGVEPPKGASGKTANETEKRDRGASKNRPKSPQNGKGKTKFKGKNDKSNNSPSSSNSKKGKSEKSKDKDKEKTSKNEPPSEDELKRLRNRVRCVKELIDTEETYVAQLETLVELYITPLADGKIVKQKYYAALFPDISTILGLNTNLLVSLKQKFENWDNEKSVIGDEFVKFAPYFKMYQNYVNNHETATRVLHGLDQTKSFQDFCAQQQANPKAKGLNLASFLILPIQRVPRYELCLREVIKLTKEEHPDYANLKKAYDDIVATNAAINERMKQADLREKVRSVERRFRMGAGTQLVAPARVYVREGYMYKVCRKKDRKYLFILFSDLLIYCSESGDNKLVFHQALPLNRYFKLEKVDNNRKYGNRSFEMHSTVKSFLVVCENLSERDRWMDDISGCLNKMRANRGFDEDEKVEDRILTTAPIWIPDDFSERCMMPSCMKTFSLMRRRHHCRYCGRLVCGDCSNYKLPHFSKTKDNEVCRVCKKCYGNYKVLFPNLDEMLKQKKKNSTLMTKSPHSGDEDSNSDNDSSDDESVMTAKTATMLKNGTSGNGQNMDDLEDSLDNNNNGQDPHGKRTLSFSISDAGFHDPALGGFTYPAMTPKEKNDNRISSKFFGNNKKKNKNDMKTQSATLSTMVVKSNGGNSGNGSANSSRGGSPAPPNGSENASPRTDGTKGKQRSLTNISLSTSTTQPAITPEIPPLPAPVGVTSADKLNAMSEADAKARVKYLEQQIRNVESKYQATINVMQMKLHDARKKNSELEGQISDLRKENGNLRKSKIDLMTWANTEIGTLKKKCTKYKTKLEALQNGTAEGAAT